MVIWFDCFDFYRLWGYLFCVFKRLSLVWFYCLCSLFFLSIATMSFAGYFLVRSLLSAFSAYLRTFFRLDFVWFRLSCDHGWIRSGSVIIITMRNCSPVLIPYSMFVYRAPRLKRAPYLTLSFFKYLNVLTFSPLTEGCSKCLGAF